MLASQGHLLQLMRVLTSSNQDGIVTWAAYCVHLMQDSSTAAAHTGHANRQSGSCSGSVLSCAVLNVLSFAPGVLPGLWRWLAVTAGFPLEAPLQASRGLDIAAVAQGPQGLQEQVVVVLGLFCRLMGGGHMAEMPWILSLLSICCAPVLRTHVHTSSTCALCRCSSDSAACGVQS